MHTNRGQERTSDPLKLQLWDSIWVLGIKHRCSGRGVSLLNLWAISPEPSYCYLIEQERKWSYHSLANFSSFGLNFMMWKFGNIHLHLHLYFSNLLSDFYCFCLLWPLFEAHLYLNTLNESNNPKLRVWGLFYYDWIHHEWSQNLQLQISSYGSQTVTLNTFL